MEILFIALLFAIFLTLLAAERLRGKKATPQAKIEEYWNGRERRQHIRFDKTLDIEYAVVKRHHIKNTCKAVDISEGGMKMLLDEKLQKGAILSIKISLPGYNTRTAVEGEVVWSEDSKVTPPDGRRMFYSGIKFYAIRESDRTCLIDYIRSLA